MKSLDKYILRQVPDSTEATPNINEHLKSIDPKFVLKQLNNWFSKGKDARFKIQAKSDGQTPILQLETDWEMRDNHQLYKELCEQLDLMMWFITISYDEPAERDCSDKWVFQIEPVVADNVSEYI